MTSASGSLAHLESQADSLEDLKTFSIKLIGRSQTYPQDLHYSVLFLDIYVLVGKTWMEPWYNVVTQDFFCTARNFVRTLTSSSVSLSEKMVHWNWGKISHPGCSYLVVLRVYTYGKIWNIMWITDYNHYRSTVMSNESVQSLDWSQISYVTLRQNLTIYWLPFFFPFGNGICYCVWVIWSLRNIANIKWLAHYLNLRRCLIKNNF